MGTRGGGQSKRKGEGADEPSPGGSGRLLVEHEGTQRPFMRGIMVHSLMARGVSFDVAYRTAEEVRERARGLGVVRPEDLAKLVSELLRKEGVGAPASAPLAAEINVMSSSGRAIPFSKGLLSQSLLAASLDPTDAFEVAREIELELLRRGVACVERRELRRLSYETLLQRFGETTADRYLIWREYQEPEKPVIILLGGTTGAGKTSLALEVARRLGIRRVMSTDAIRQVMRIMLSPELMPAIHVSSFDAHRHLPHPASSEDAVIEGFMSQAAAVSVGVRAIIERTLAENSSLVFDGVALVPGVVDLAAYEDDAHIIFLVAATLDADAFGGRFELRGDRQRRGGQHRYVENLDEILRIQEHFLELAEAEGVPIVDNLSIESSVQLIIRHVVETLRMKGEFSPESLL